MAEAELLQAKALLLQAGPSGLNLYDHLSEIIAKVLDERPQNAAETLEDISRAVKATRFQHKGSNLQNVPEVSRDVTLATAQAKLFRAPQGEDEEQEGQHVLPNLMEIAQFFEDNSVGLGREETFRIFLALKQLSEAFPLKSVRLWGKILGIESNYVIAEAEYKEGEEPRPPENEGEAEEADNSGAGAGEENPDALPKSQYKPPAALPVEEYGHGTNKKIYFVCSEPGTEWRLLPDVTPAQISTARQIRKFFTGRLDAPVVSYPPFPGTEANLLRAQIARITAGTHVSPIGYYTFDEDGEEDEETRETFIVNEEFEEKPRSELLATDLSGWVHHAPHILPQGRCRWVNPNPPKERDGDDEDEEEEEDAEAQVEPETGPPLLQPLQNDEDVDGQPAWTPKLSSSFVPGYSSVCIASNRWPGAFAFAVGKKFDNIYIGFGHKYSSDPYSPPLPPPAENEYPVGPEITEATDPSREEEAAFEAAQAQAREEAEAADEGEEDED